MKARAECSVLLLLGLLTLSACATNQLRLQYAGDVASRAKVTTNAASVFLNEVDAARTEANIELVAADPACGRQRPILRASPTPPTGAAGTLCVPATQQPGPGDTAVSLAPIAQDLKPTVVLISALALYGEGLADILDRAEPNAGDAFDDAVQTARSAQGLLSAVGAVSAPPAADDTRLVAATKLIGFIGELAAEQRKVGDVRAYLKAHGAEAKKVITGLERSLSTWENARKADAALRSGIAASIAQAVLARQPPALAIERRDTLREFYARQREASAQAGLYPALSNALIALGAANDDLGRVIVQQPKLNAKERAIVAELARKRLIRAMDGIAALINAFPGV